MYLGHDLKNKTNKLYTLYTVYYIYKNIYIYIYTHTHIRNLYQHYLLKLCVSV